MRLVRKFETVETVLAAGRSILKFIFFVNKFLGTVVLKKQIVMSERHTRKGRKATLSSGFDKFNSILQEDYMLLRSP